MAFSLQTAEIGYFSHMLLMVLSPWMPQTAHPWYGAFRNITTHEEQLPSLALPRFYKLPSTASTSIPQ